VSRRRFRHVLEIGGGRGDVARDFVRAWAAKPQRSARSYTILDLSRALLRSQRKLAVSRLVALRLIQADAHRLPFQDGAFDGIVIANEMLADLDAWELRMGARNGHAPAAVQTVLHRYRLRHHLRHPVTMIPIGLIRLLEELHRVVTPRTQVILTEYFDLKGGGCANVFGEAHHVECRLNLELVCTVAQGAGFAVRVMALSDFLDLRITAPVLTERFGLFLKHVLGYPVSPTFPSEEARLSRWLGSRFRGHTDGLYSRAELQYAAADFYVLVLSKRTPLPAARVQPEMVVRREPHVRKLTARNGARMLVTAYPLTCRRLNDAAEWLWDRIDGRRSAEVLARGLARRYAIPASRALRDTLAFLRMAARCRYVHADAS
jgi:hypothetical protein